jgi:glycine cleavage system aminomethyltransferase T
LHGGEVVLAGDRVLGRVTSGGFGHTLGRNILCAYLAADEPADSGVTIEVMGERFPAQRHARPPYDSERRSILA